jgi:hypothetical protein
MVAKPHTLTSIARILRVDYRKLRDHMVKPQPVATVVISARELPLYRAEQFKQDARLEHSLL